MHFRSKRFQWIHFHCSYEPVPNACQPLTRPVKDARESPFLAFASEDLLLQLQHDVRDLDILLCLILGSDLEDDVLLVLGDGLLADGLDEGGHPERTVSVVLDLDIVGRTYFMGRRSLFFDAG